MKCDECLQLIDLYFDGELSSCRSSCVAAHLEGCDSCSREYHMLGDEQSLYLRYGCDSAESPAFWDEVLSRAEADKTTTTEARAPRLRRWLACTLSPLAATRFSPTVTAAMLLATAGLTVAIMKFVLPRDKGRVSVAESGYKDGFQRAEYPAGSGSELSRTAAAVGLMGGTSSRESARPIPKENFSGRGLPKAKTSDAGAIKGMQRMRMPAKAEPSPDKLIREAEGKYLAAIAALSHDVGRRRPRMDAEAVTHFERTLAIVDRAIAETRAAARKHPRDPEAVQYMMAAYTKKMDLLREMAQD